MKFQTSTNGLDPSLKIPFTTIGSVNKSDRVIHLGPEETTVVQATIKMPNEKFNGLISVVGILLSTAVMVIKKIKPFLVTTPI